MNIGTLHNAPEGKRVLGVDPGTRIMGFAVVEVRQQTLFLEQYGIIKLTHLDDHKLKLKTIFEKTTALIERHLPDELAIEVPFYNKNPDVLLKLGRAQGVAMAAGLARQVPVTEYAAKKVKMAVTGNGNAHKQQLAGILEQMLGFKHGNKALDATDALAVAVCHLMQGPTGQKSKGGWGEFLRENPNRIKK